VQGPRGLSITTQNPTLARLDLCTPKVAVEAEGRGQRQAKEQQLMELWPCFLAPLSNGLSLRHSPAFTAPTPTPNSALHMNRRDLLLQTHPWFPNCDAAANANAQLESSKLRPALAVVL